MELMDAADSAIPEPVRELDKPFLMPIEDVFTIHRSWHGGHRQDRAGQDPHG